MENKIIVRTDIIDPHTYLDIELGYKNLIESIFKCGGYALFHQIYKYYGNKTKGYREIKKLEELLLIGSEQLNRNKYIYLKFNALKYMKYKDYEEINEVPTVNRLEKNPSYKPLMNSIFSFEYFIENNELINTDRSIRILKILLDDVVNLFEKNRLKNIHFANVAKEDYRKQLETRIKFLGDRNSIYLKDYIQGDSLQNSILMFVWYDFNQETRDNLIQRVLILISRFLNLVGTKERLNCCKFSLEIVTISEERKKIIQSISEKTLKNIEKKNLQYLKNSIKTKENKVISNIHEITYTVFPDIENYINTSVRGDNEFNFMDVDTVDRIAKLKDAIGKNKE